MENWAGADGEGCFLFHGVVLGVEIELNLGRGRRKKMVVGGRLGGTGGARN